MTHRAPWQRRLLRFVLAGALVAAAPALPVVFSGSAGGTRAGDATTVAAAWGALAAQGAPPRQARAAERRGWTSVRVAKWALAGVTVGLGYYAFRQSARADRAYSDLRRLCVTTPRACTLDAGRYPDARAEGLYGTSLSHDRHAQTGILVGQATLLASAALFVYDLRNGHGPENIPFPGVPAQLTARPTTPRSAASSRPSPLPTPEPALVPFAAPLTTFGTRGGPR
jgi:hypothetical protein